MKNLLGPILRRLTRYDAPNSPSWSPGTVGALTVLCLAGLGACVLSSSVGCYHADAPKTKARTATGLVCNSALWNFGDIDATIHPILSHSFTLENTSRTPITMDVRSTCGCIVLEGAQKTLVPGESTEVKVRLELSRVPGPVRRQLLVQTRTPDDGMILSIVGEQKVNAALRSFPEEIDFGTITQGTSKTCTVRVARWDKTRCGSSMYVSQTITLELSDYWTIERKLKSHFSFSWMRPIWHCTITIPPLSCHVYIRRSAS